MFRIIITVTLALMCAHTMMFNRAPSNVYSTNRGVIVFLSDAPLESIEAKNESVSAAIDLSNKTMTFKVPINAFHGFNSKLQETHFNENYMETESIPSATFVGKVIEDVDLTVPGTYTVRAKGMLNIHDIEVERVVKGVITISDSEVMINADFQVALEDHEIKTPKIITQKIAEEVDVQVRVSLLPSDS